MKQRLSEIKWHHFVVYFSLVIINIFLGVSWFENFDLETVVTPVKVEQLEKQLRNVNYDPVKIEYLVDGFRHGFELHYEGPQDVRHTAPNLKLRVGNKFDLWEKVMKEVAAKRYAGPFEKPPLESFIQSPIGLVPKDKGTKTQLIFHLSYPKTGQSVNSEIPDELCLVEYPDFMQAVNMCLHHGKKCSMSKSDMSMAFRNCPIRIKDIKWLVLKAEHPISGQVFYFVYKCLPFGSSISCTIFQSFCDAIAHIVSYRTVQPTWNYLDDFFFVHLLRLLCNEQVDIVLEV